VLLFGFLSWTVTVGLLGIDCELVDDAESNLCASRGSIARGLIAVQIPVVLGFIIGRGKTHRTWFLWPAAVAVVAEVVALVVVGVWSHNR